MKILVGFTLLLSAKDKAGGGRQEKSFHSKEDKLHCTFWMAHEVLCRGSFGAGKANKEIGMDVQCFGLPLLEQRCLLGNEERFS